MASDAVKRAAGFPCYMGRPQPMNGARRRQAADYGETALLDKCRHMHAPAFERITHFVRITRSVVDPRYARLVPTDMVQHGLHDMWQHAKIGHSRGARSTEIVQRPSGQPHRSVEASFGTGPRADGEYSASADNRELSKREQGQGKGRKWNCVGAPILRSRRGNGPHVSDDLVPLHLADFIAALASEHEQPNDASKVVIATGPPDRSEFVVRENPFPLRSALRPIGSGDGICDEVVALPNGPIEHGR